ncbi:alpha-1,4-glucan--maltose-1-phosphate maltosyltransferase [Oryzifoliimicrobium ureilyticus]|uniref:alpha-1,4-glucan--maltose-1-phosphate maltosyltransferase n=1 Tax=Oryzifoliimicrobium ureilyticus TaxID=3113724 RepID=UPI0030764BC5
MMNGARKRLLAKRIYYVHPLMLRGLDAWQEAFAHARDLGFDTIVSAPLFARHQGASVFASADYTRLDEALGLRGNPVEAISSLARSARELGLRLYLDVPANIGPRVSGALDPRFAPHEPSVANPLDNSDGLKEAWIREWSSRLSEWASLGITGFRCLGLSNLTASDWQGLINSARQASPELEFLAWTPGTAFELRQALRDTNFAASFSSFAWWDLKEDWFGEEYRLQSQIGPQITFPEAPFFRRVAHGMEGREIIERRALLALKLAAFLGDGVLIPMGFEYGASTPLDPMTGHSVSLRALKTNCPFDLSSQVRAANEEISDRTLGSLRINVDAASTVTVLAQTDQADLRQADAVRLIVANRDLRRSAPMPARALREIAKPFLPIDEPDEATRLRPGETRRLSTRSADIVKAAGIAVPVEEAVAYPRIAIEMISPQVDAGRFPVKRIVGDIVTVEADIFADGHDVLAASLFFRAVDEAAWREARMTLIENDRWRASFALDRIGRYEFAVEAWKSAFAIYRYELTKKYEARLDLRLELLEGLAIVEDAVRNPAQNFPSKKRPQLEALLSDLRIASDPHKVDLLLSSETAELMALADRRPFRVRSEPSFVDAERREAGFASWYQIFPRSQSGDPSRHGTFDDVIARLPAIREMGFDVLYFPPIHPIGRKNRKGRNNSLTPGPNDPGSPYAIGSEAGGHEAIHPELGNFDDFRRLVEAANDHGLEIALDLAIQASPDHPWLKDHPGWFDWRPDGTIRYAENPPKKYEDIVNVDFYTKDAVPSLWVTLRDIVQLWVDQGVKLFRVDNPHTKPLPFWEWLIGDIRERHPDVVFLSEAFTRPKVMYRLAKVGFSQSYTYFTWRNTRWELEQYMLELTQTAVKDFFRPHFFVNTHDINPDFLQNAPRPAYLIRAALAATLSGLWGVYNGFELCEGRPDAKRKEYADSEKYEIRAWDWDRPGNIKAEIALLNRLRRDNPALHSHLGLTLLGSSNSNVMFFEKASAGRHNVLLIAVSMDPYNVQESDIEIPLWNFGLDDGGALAMEDLIGGGKFILRGKWQRVRLDPNGMPFTIWRIRSEEV